MLLATACIYSNASKYFSQRLCLTHYVMSHDVNFSCNQMHHQKVCYVSRNALSAFQTCRDNGTTKINYKFLFILQIS